MQADRQASSCEETGRCGTSTAACSPAFGSRAALQGPCADSQLIEDALLSTLGHIDSMASMPSQSWQADALQTRRPDAGPGRRLILTPPHSRHGQGGVAADPSAMYTPFRGECAIGL